MIDGFGEDGPVLALVAGQYYPVVDFRIDIGTSVQPVARHDNNGMQMQNVDYSAEFTTPRPPDVQNYPPTDGYLIDRDNKIKVEDCVCVAHEYSMNLNKPGGNDNHSVELAFLGYDVMER